MNTQVFSRVTKELESLQHSGDSGPVTADPALDQDSKKYLELMVIFGHMVLREPGLRETLLQTKQELFLGLTIFIFPWSTVSYPRPSMS